MDTAATTAAPTALQSTGGDLRLAVAVAEAIPALEAIELLGPEWTALAGEASEPNAYAESWFVDPGLRRLAPPGEVRMLAVRQGGRLDGLLPLWIAPRYGRMPVRHVENWLHPHCLLGTPLVRAGQEQAFWAAALAALDGAGWAPAFLHVSGLVDQGPVHRGLIAAARALGRPCDTVHRTRRALLASGLSPQAYYETNVRKKKRKELKRLRARLAEQGELRFRALAAGDDLGAWSDSFLAIERSGWKGRSGSALASTPEGEAFFREVLAGAHAAGRLQFLRLDLDGRPLAMLVNFLTPPGSFSFKIAFDEAFARFSPGVLIELENLRVLEHPDIAWMDSCAVEDHPMIDSLWSGRRSLVRVTVPLAGLRRRALFQICRTAENGSAALRRLLASPPAPGPKDSRDDD